MPPIRLNRTAQAPQIPRRSVGIVEALASDHARVREMIAQVVQDPGLAASLYPQIADILRRHDIAESQTLYEALAKGPLAAQIQTSRAQHARLAAAWRRLDNTNVHHAVWNSRFAEMVRALEAHLHVEETRVFAAARQLPIRLQQRLATQYRQLMKHRVDNPPVYRANNPSAFRANNPQVRQVQVSWFDRYFGGGKDLVMNPGARQILGPRPVIATQSSRRLNPVTINRVTFCPAGYRACGVSSTTGEGACCPNPKYTGSSFAALSPSRARRTRFLRFRVTPPINNEDRFWHPWRYPPRVAGQAQAAGEVHTDAFGNQYVVAGGARRL